MPSTEQLERKIQELENLLKEQRLQIKTLLAKSEKALETALHAYKVDHFGFIWVYQYDTNDYVRTDMRIMSPELVDKAVKTRNLADGAVTGEKIAPGAVTSDKIADKTIKDRHIDDKAIKERHIDDKAIKSRHIGDGEIKGRHIAEGAITYDKIAPETLDGKIITEVPLPRFEIEVIDGVEWIVAYWSDEGAIKDIFSVDEGENTTAIYVLLTDGDASKDEKDGWEEVAPNQSFKVDVSSDLEDVVCPVTLIEGSECTILYENTTTDQTFNVTVSPEYKTPDGEVVAIIVPAGGYAEVSWLMTDGNIYVRGIGV